MAKIINILWESPDQGPLILPSNVPLDVSDVQSELMRYLDEPWIAVIHKDVDGSNSLPKQIDNQYPNIGRYSAARRVARTLFFGSAPTFNAANRGIDEQRIKLGSALPGETIATFNDALRHLADKATYVYHQNQNFWYSTQNNVNRTADERAMRINDDDIEEEILAQLTQQLSASAGKLKRIHFMPQNTNDVPDDMEMKLVVLGISTPHSQRDTKSKAFEKAKEILSTKGASQRLYRNTLIFLAPDRARLEELKQAVKLYRAWKSIVDDKVHLNLDAYQANQADAKRRTGLDTIKLRLPETFVWVLTPFQETGNTEIIWDDSKLNGSSQEVYMARILRKLTTQSLLYNDFTTSELRMNLDKIPLWRGNDVPIRQIREDFAKYLYLPKLSSPQLLQQAIETGVGLVSWNKDSFALADFYDHENERYKGLRAGISLMIQLDGNGLLVKPDIAKEQLDKEKAEAAEKKPEDGTSPDKPYPEDSDHPPVNDPGTASPEAIQTRFFGHMETDATRFFRSTDVIEKEILKHLCNTPGCKVKISIHIEAEKPDGFDQADQRTLKENANTIGFNHSAFE